MLHVSNTTVREVTGNPAIYLLPKHFGLCATKNNSFRIALLKKLGLSSVIVGELSPVTNALYRLVEAQLGGEEYAMNFKDGESDEYD
jgi:hypothetical protein